jgi:hypothetical protein
MKGRARLIIIFWILSYSLFAQPASRLHIETNLRDLKELRLLTLQRSYKVEEIEPNILKLTHRETGLIRYVNVSNIQLDFDNPFGEEQVIDLINTDTTLYNNKYNRKNMFPVGGLSGYPMTIGDFNNNGRLDLLGTYKIPQDHELADCAIAELKEDSTFEIKRIYKDSVYFALASTDLDGDGLKEINLRRNQLFYNYEASHPDSFPNVFNFSHRMWEISSVVGSETFAYLDDDNNMDVLYRGDDSLPPVGSKIFVAEYNPAINRFEKKFSHRPQPEWRISGFSVGDFDEDGLTEFVTGSVDGDIYIFENNGNDSYHQVFYDTLTAPNAYLTGVTNDIDNNGKIEFFVGGSGFYQNSSASRVYWFESDGNNSYVKVRRFLLIGTDVLGTTELFIHDVNLDGVDDLVFSFSYSVVILTWNQSSFQFEVYYLDWWENYDQIIQSVNMYDVFGRGKLDLFVNIKELYAIPRIRTYYYQVETIAGINPPDEIITEFALYQNYPNPFNKSTKLNFRLSKSNRISLTIYDISGKEVISLIRNEVYSPGEYEVSWDGENHFGKEVSSGTYLYEFIGSRFREIRKMLLVK